MDEPKKQHVRTCNSLRLNLEAAAAGKTWLLLPTGMEGKTYPLPTGYPELQKIIAIPIPPNSKRDQGCIYLRRALENWKNRSARRQSALLHIEAKAQQTRRIVNDLKSEVQEAKAEINQAVEETKKQAELAVANLNDLFALGRKGLEGQMRAHLDHTEWQGEEISAKAFRECFQMVTSAVKGLGVPSDQRPKAVDAIMEEAAASMKSTQETLAMAPGNDPETTH